MLYETPRCDVSTKWVSLFIITSREGVVEVLRGAGIEVSEDWEMSEKVLEEDRERTKLQMGSRVEKRKKEIATLLAGKEMDKQQRKVVDVYTPDFVTHFLLKT